MAISIASLPVVPLDLTNRGRGMHIGMTQLQGLLDASGGREGYLVAKVKVGSTEIPVVLARSDLYVAGFQSSGNWYRFDDAEWPFTEAAAKLGHDGQYSTLGGLSGNLTAGGVEGIARLASSAHRSQWREALRTLLVVVSESARLIPVRMQITGLLNEVLPLVPLAPLARYIQNWDKASKGMDMSQEKSPTHRVGFRDPVITKR